ncbi:MAG: Acetylglutamate kinase [Phycisphaerae bacterium]|nr:Acetylglutamate kinase [Phycisphaerae bacterium]
MQEAIGKANALIEAMDYIRKFRDKIVVVKLGGSIMDDPEEQGKLLADVLFMATVGMQPVLVHGGGKAISAKMNEAGLEPQFVQGYRYTDERTLAIVEQVLCIDINLFLVQTIQSLGGSAMGLHSLSSCVVVGERMYLEDGDRRVDIGLVGKVCDVNAHLLRVLCSAGTIPVIAPIARDRRGGKLNINADIVAGEVAAALKAEKLVMLSDTHGIRTDPKDPQSLASSLTEAQVQEMIRTGVIDKGMLPKVQACLRALEAGVGKTHIIDGRFAHSLLLEIYTAAGVGTEIVK